MPLTPGNQREQHLSFKHDSHNGSNAMAKEKIWHRWRVNGIVGRVVPIFLLIYLVLAYHLVIIEFDTRQSYRKHGQSTTPLIHAIACHAFLLPPLWAYLRIYLSQGVGTTTGGPLEHHRWLGGAVNPTPLIDPPDVLLSKQVIFECDSKGQPLRCFRDNCNGRWKPARARHCGDCRQCRLALDHHCPWFDADITAPHTLMPFLLFLAFIPPLLIVAFAPLLMISYRHIAYIWRCASNSQDVHNIWWSRKRSWIGGPMYRWLIGLWLGYRQCCLSTDDSFDSPNLYLPIMTLLAIALILIALALLVATLQQLVVGDLTIDTRIRKLLQREMSTEERQRWQKYYWVPLPDTLQGGAIVTLAAHEQPYNLASWKDNMRAFLCLKPHTLEQLQLQWPISAELKTKLIAKADEELRKTK